MNLKGELLVSDPEQRCVHVLSPSGELVAQYKRVIKPAGLALLSNGNLAVSGNYIKYFIILSYTTIVI